MFQSVVTKYGESNHTAKVVGCDDIPTGAKIEVLFSERKGIAAILYDHPNISDAFIEWVFCTSPDDALTEWKRKVRWPLIETSRDPIEIIGEAQP